MRAPPLAVAVYWTSTCTHVPAGTVFRSVETWLLPVAVYAVSDSACWVPS